jgi:anthranilate/para-aminobenzoate synthase component II
LAAKGETVPHSLKITATADDGTIMVVRHKQFLVEGIQFHPESIRMNHLVFILSLLKGQYYLIFLQIFFN